jgi:ribosomal protein RSM22 (predicted rRNA methylase)
MRTIALPDVLRIAVSDMAEDVPRLDLRNTVARLSAGYRSETGVPMDSRSAVIAYLVYRFPATYAAASAVMVEVNARLPALQPMSWLDVGCGPGTAVLAAASQWPHLIDTGVGELVDTSAAMRDIAARLVAAIARENNATRLHAVSKPLSDLQHMEPRSVTVATYVLGELTTSDSARLIDALWGVAQDCCILIEPGTPAGSERIRRATQQLVDLGACILAPTPFEWQTLVSPTDWLHFSVRVPRSRLARFAKASSLSHEDEKYSYLIASRHAGTPYAARVIRHPQSRSGHIRLRLSTATGIEDVVVGRSRKDGYTIAKRLEWGDPLSSADLRAVMAES